MLDTTNKTDTTINFINFPTNGILHYVNVDEKTIKIGELTLKFPTVLYDYELNQNKMFLDNFLFFKVIEDVPDEFSENVTIKFIDGYQSGDNVQHRMSDGTHILNDFCGLEIHSQYGLLLKIGFRTTSRGLIYAFTYNNDRHTWKFPKPLNNLSDLLCK